ncbi:tRNA glutamyl-Q(34) synthetase GluQRS [Orbaceae bacterium ac157xtp]
MKHIGRFAPSPSGYLHFGSFITALGSYLHAKSQNGLWLVRIEDIDPPREVAGSATHILNTLTKIGLEWDREVLYQSTRTKRYNEIIDALFNRNLLYYCDCTRQRISTLPNGVYDNFCRHRNLTPSTHQPMSIRLKQLCYIDLFIDNIRDKHKISKYEADEDYIILRKDGLFAYNLAVVVDDHDQGVTDVVRGADLLSVTTKQIALYQLMGWTKPCYYHLPSALNQNHNKLSKQNHAKPINLNNIPKLIIDGLGFLGQPIPNGWQDLTVPQLLSFAIQHWDVQHIPKKDAIFIDD